MNPDSVKNFLQALIDGLTPLAEKLGIAIGGIFGWALKHNFALGAYDLFMAVLGIGMAWWGSKKVFALANDYSKQSLKMVNSDNKQNLGTWSQMLLVVGILMIVVGLAFGLPSLYHAMVRFIAPEYSTSQDIVNLIHASKQ